MLLVLVSSTSKGLDEKLIILVEIMMSFPHTSPEDPIPFAEVTHLFLLYRISFTTQSQVGHRSTSLLSI